MKEAIDLPSINDDRLITEPLVSAALRVRDKLRRQFETEFQEGLQIVRRDFEERMRAAEEAWIVEREALRSENQELRRYGDFDSLKAAIAEAESSLANLEAEIQAMLNEEKVELTTLMQKNAAKVTLEAYLKGLRFRE